MTDRKSPKRTPPAPDEDKPEPLLILTGATAVGKTALSLVLAEAAELEIISMDSMLVYRGMDVGTAKPNPAEQRAVTHHGLDLVEPAETYDVSRWLEDARKAQDDVRARGKRALFVGGTGFYLQALVRGLFRGPSPDPQIRVALEARVTQEGSPALHAELLQRDPPAGERIHPNDAKRIVRALEVLESTGRTLSDWQREWGWHGRTPIEHAHRVVGLALPKTDLDQRILRRTRAMLDGGWPEEVESILAGSGFGPGAIQALGYRAVIELVEGRRTRSETETQIALATRQFARRQKTWFRRFPDTLWLDPTVEESTNLARVHLGL